MSAVDVILRRAHGFLPVTHATRSTLRELDPAVRDALTFRETPSGAVVSVDSSFTHGDVYACIRVLADAASSVPLIVYRRTPAGRVRAGETLAARVIENPSPVTRQGVLMGTVMAHLQGWGNAFIAKYRGPGGAVEQLGVIQPHRVVVSVTAGEPLYTVRQDDGTDLRLNRRDIIHVRGMSLDGVMGLSPIQQARGVIGLGITLEDAAGRLLRNDARPGGVLKHPARLTLDAAERLKAGWRAATSGDNRGSVAVLEEGMEYQQVGLSPADAQFIEQRRMSATQIARVFRVPPHMIGAESGSTMTYSNVEQEALQFVTFSLTPWLVAIEQAFGGDEDLFPAGGGLYPEFLLDALLRADTKTRNEALSLATWWTTNEKRRLDNLPDMPGGDAIHEPASGGQQ